MAKLEVDWNAVAAAVAKMDAERITDLEAARDEIEAIADLLQADYFENWDKCLLRLRDLVRQLDG